MFNPDGEAWVEVCVQTFDDARHSDDDLIGSLSLIRALGIDPQIGGADGKRDQRNVRGIT